jgi:hypothetical protein
MMLDDLAEAARSESPGRTEELNPFALIGQNGAGDIAISGFDSSAHSGALFVGQGVALLPASPSISPTS